jgi:glycosyltransferase involved in cell wall biosynthesis
MLFSWPRRSVLWAWRRCLLAIVPSVWREPFGTVVIEAMAMGKPVIASRIGGMPDLIADGETGVLVPPGDAAALRAAIDRLLVDGETRERLGRAAAQRVPRFHVSAVVPRIERVYRSLLQPPLHAEQGSRPVA